MIAFLHGIWKKLDSGQIFLTLVFKVDSRLSRFRSFCRNFQTKIKTENLVSQKIRLLSLIWCDLVENSYPWLRTTHNKQLKNQDFCWIRVLNKFSQEASVKRRVRRNVKMTKAISGLSFDELLTKKNQSKEVSKIE